MEIAEQNQPVVPSAVPNPPPAQEPVQFKIPEPSSSKFPTGFVVLLFFIAILGIGIYLGKTYFSSLNIFSKPTPTPTVTVISPSAAPTVNPTANWKTYKNDVFGFEFRYPSGFILKDTLPGKVVTTSPTENINLKNATADIEMVIDINMAGYGPFFPNEMWDLDYAKEKGIFPVKKIEQDVKQYRQDNYLEIRTSAKTIAGKPISFMFRYQKTKDYKQLFSQILSTFKLTVNQALDQPEIASPAANSKIASPLTVKGKVPAGWMFEGQFPIKLTDASKNIIASASAKEMTPGSWTNGKPVDFQATLTFTTSEKTGFLILNSDNPSGDPAKAKSFELPVSF